MANLTIALQAAMIERCNYYPKVHKVLKNKDDYFQKGMTALNEPYMDIKKDILSEMDNAAKGTE
jgi:hypothetical protein